MFNGLRCARLTRCCGGEESGRRGHGGVGRAAAGCGGARFSSVKLLEQPGLLYAPPPSPATAHPIPYPSLLLWCRETLSVFIPESGQPAARPFDRAFLVRGRRASGLPLSPDHAARIAVHAARIAVCLPTLALLHHPQRLCTPHPFTARSRSSSTCRKRATALKCEYLVASGQGRDRLPATPNPRPPPSTDAPLNSTDAPH